MLGGTYVLLSLIGNVEVDSHEEIFKALSGVIHDAQLEALLILKGLCQGTPESVRWKYFLTAALELVKDSFESTEDARIPQALVRRELPEATAEDVQVP